MTPVDVIIERWLGVKEATGNNDGPDVLHITRGDKVPWCAAMILRAIEHAGWPKPPASEEARARHGDRWAWYYENRLVQAFEENMREAGMLVPRDTAARDDLVFYADRAGSDAGGGKVQRHVDIIERVTTDEHPAMLLYVIGGNLGNAVKRRTISVEDPRITSIGRLARPG